MDVAVGPRRNIKWMATAVAAMLVSSIVVVFVGGASAIPVSSGVLGGFQQEGNQADDDGPGTGDDAEVDWASSTVNDAGLIKTVDEGSVDGNDIGYQGSSKEQKPSDWVCNADGGDDPDKGNILRTYVNPRSAEGFIDLAWVRKNISGTGDVEVNYEFNQQAPPANVGTDCDITRVTGDVMIEYGFPGGNSPPDIDAYRWVAHAPADVTTHEDGLWVNLNLTTDDVKAAVNNVALTDDLLTAAANDALAYQSFGEATVRITALMGSGSDAACRDFSHLNIRSKSSRSDNALPALQDKLPTAAIDVTTCGKITIKKVDDHSPAQPVEGAVFKLYKADDLDTAVGTCTTTAAGLCVFEDVKPGSYYIKEHSVPAGYGGTTETIGPIEVSSLEHEDLTGTPVVNPRLTGHVQITKALADENGSAVTPDDASDLDGATFVVYNDLNTDGDYDAPTETAKLWPAETAAATCTVADGDGACTIGPLPTGAYRLTETAAPAGTNLTAADQAISITSAHTAQAPLATTMTNTLSALNVTMAKTGPAAAYVGDTIAYSFSVSTSGPKLHDVAIEELVAGRCDSDPVLSANLSTGEEDGFLNSGDSWVFTCSHVVLVGDLLLLNSDDELENSALATGEDDFGRKVDSAPDGHDVLIVQPSIEIDKKVNGGDHKPASSQLVVQAGDVVTYDLTITNDANVAMEITELTDSLYDFAVLPSDCDELIGDVVQPGASVSCSYTEEADGARHNEVHVAAVDDVLGDAAKGRATGDDETFLDTVDPGVTITKTGASMAREGDVVTYTFVVKNTGDVPLVELIVTDDVLGTVGTIDGPLAPGAEATLTKDYTVPVGTANIVNVAEVCAEPVPDGDPVCHSDDHTLDPMHPSVTIDKTANPVTVGNGGGPVTYTYVVSNTGDVTLTNVTVTDDILGPIGTVASLAPGGSTTLTKTVTVGMSTPSRNVGTVVGTDPTGRTVTDDDDAVIAVVAGVVFRQVELPRTGADIEQAVFIALLLMSSGSMLVVASRRRRALG